MPANEVSLKKYWIIVTCIVNPDPVGLSGLWYKNYSIIEN
jgi:hypothetical protein